MPAVETVPASRPPDHCPNPKHPCSGTTFHRYGAPTKAVRNVFVHQVGVQRWKCTTCGYVFRVYPQGVTHRQQSIHLHALSTCSWLLGMSLGAVTDALAALNVPMGRTTVHDTLRQSCTRARWTVRERARRLTSVRVVGGDCTHVPVRGHETVVMQAVDAQTGLTLEITPLRAEDEQTIVRYVRRMPS